MLFRFSTEAAVLPHQMNRQLHRMARKVSEFVRL